MSGEALAVTSLAGAKWLTDLGIVWLVGVSALRLTARGAGVGGAPLDARLRRQAGLALAVLFVGTAARLWAQTYASFGLEESVTAELVRLVAEETRWGGRWVMQAGAAVLAAVAAFLLLVAPRWGWRVFGALGLVVVGTTPLTGHAMAMPTWWPLGLQILHLLAAGVWLGTLGVLLTAGLGTLRTHGSAPSAVSRLVDRFSPVALAAAATLAATGLVTAWFYVDTPTALWRSSYGRVLSLKTGLFLATAALGAYNWKRVRPALAAGDGVGRLRRTGGAELGLAVLLLAVTAWLVHLPMPGE